MSGRPIMGKLCLSKVAPVAILVLALTLLATGCMRFTYDETPTPMSYAAESPVSTPTVAPAATVPTLAVWGPTMLRLEPSVVELAVGETRLVQVLIDNAEQLRGVDLHISFEPGYVHVEDASPDVEGVQIAEGAIPMPAQVVQNEANNDTGVIIYNVAAENPVDGSGMVASFTVRALAEGGSPLRFTVVNLQGPEGQSLPAPERVDGLVIVGAGSAAPEPAAEVVPTETPPAATPTETPPAATPTETPPTTTTPTSTPVPPAPTASPVPSSSPQTGGIYHKVQWGENLFRIALRYGTTVDAIVAANNLPNRNSVQVGQVLLIPVSSPAGTVVYVVVPGDTLYSIARRFGTTIEALAALNGIAPPYPIKAGQVLIIVP